jgi:hypothetical protein
MYHLRHVIMSTVTWGNLLLRYVDDIAKRPAYRLLKVVDKASTHTHIVHLHHPGYSNANRVNTNCSSLVVFCPVLIQLLIDIAYLLPQIAGRF